MQPHWPRATAARRARVELKDRLKRGALSLPQLFSESATDDVIGKTRVFEVLTALPQIGKMTAHDIMTEVGIAPTRRVRGLTHRQRQGLLHKFNLTK